MFTFETRVIIPPETLKKFGDAVYEYLSTHCLSPFSDDDKKYILDQVAIATHRVVNDTEAEFQGFRMKVSQVHAIANYLEAGKRVPAIRILRHDITYNHGWGLKGIKEWFDQFPSGPVGANRFKEAFLMP